MATATPGTYKVIGQSPVRHDAAGIRMRSLPMNPAAVVKALEELEY